MIKKLETWLRKIFAGELSALELRLNTEIEKRLAAIEAKLTQHLDDLTAEAVSNFADEVADSKRSLEQRILEAENLVNHNRASAEEVAAAHQLRHPRHKR